MKNYTGKIIDIHSHTLPCVDDGSLDIADSLNMLKTSCELGTKDLILTPHYRRNFKCSVETLRAEFDKFKERAEKKGVPVNLYLGQEIFVEKDTTELLKSGKLLTLNDSKYVLLEFDFNEYTDISEKVYEFKAYGYKPIVAHIERYSYSDIEMAEEIKSIGGYIQINAESLVGKSCKLYGKKTKKLIKSGFVDFVASDYHSVRNNRIKDAADYVYSKYGLPVAKRLFFENAEEIINK